MSAPARSHLDPDMMAILDAIRAQLSRVFRAPAGSLTLAISGTGTSAMEAAIANMVAPGARALAIVNGYFGNRLAQMLGRYGANVDMLDVEWGRAADPAEVEQALTKAPYDFVTVVHAETSTGVRNPVEQITQVAHAAGALVIVDAVTSLGAIPFDMGAWDVDVCYSCSQKGLGAPSGLSPIAFSPSALEKRVACRSFYFDLSLLSAYWSDRKYHHTISAPLVYALNTALEEVEEETLERRWLRHDTAHQHLAGGLAALGMHLLPSPSDRLWNLNAVEVPDGVNEAAVRSALLVGHHLEIGAGLGPLAGRIWRVGLMGSGATAENVIRLLDALPAAIKTTAHA